MAALTRQESEVTNPVKRIRWATHRAKGLNGDKKRQSLIDRLHNRTGSGEEKKRDSTGTSKEGNIPDAGDNDSSDAGSEEQDTGRRVYFNIPLPPEERD